MPRKQLTLPEVADKLGVHYMTVYRYVRTGRLPAKRVRGAWQVDPADLAHVERSRQATRATGKAPSRARLEARLVASDEAGAWDVLEEALASGMEPDEVLLELIAPALHSIGQLWEQGKLSVADEHRASSVAARLISRLGARFARRGHRRGTVVLAAAPGELHGLPVAITANLLRWRGFDVVELGADTPAEALAETVAGEPDLVAVGVACTAKGSPQAAAVRSPPSAKLPRRCPSCSEEPPSPMPLRRAASAPTCSREAAPTRSCARSRLSPSSSPRADPAPFQWKWWAQTARAPSWPRQDGFASTI